MHRPIILLLLKNLASRMQCQTSLSIAEAQQILSKTEISKHYDWHPTTHNTVRVMEICPGVWGILNRYLILAVLKRYFDEDRTSKKWNPSSQINRLEGFCFGSVILLGLSSGISRVVWYVKAVWFMDGRHTVIIVENPRIPIGSTLYPPIMCCLSSGIYWCSITM